jgi:hypothetical protein
MVIHGSAKKHFKHIEHKVYELTKTLSFRKICKRSLMSSLLEQLLIIDHNHAFGGIVSASTDFNIFWYCSSTASVAIQDISKWKRDITKTILRNRAMEVKKTNCLLDKITKQAQFD